MCLEKSYLRRYCRRYGPRECLFFFGRHALTEQQSNAPQTGDAYDGVYDAADNCSLAAAHICHQVEFEKTDQQPVDGADDGYYK